uniref:Cytochrome c oxidase subunit 2 n=1 Tax=Bathynella cf. rufa JHS-2017 TaxID=2029186 RepID=A0A7R6D7I1_9CRUS|nr:cytochrome oxidase subunit 2 [Bathynella cf. rufa JHS-2017]
MNTWNTLNFFDSSSPLMEQLIMFHDHIMLILMLILSLVSVMMISLFFNKFSNRYLLEGQQIEIFWTILPALILVFIALPSLRLLYLSDESSSSLATVKVIGSQWYWTYENINMENQKEMNSYMLPEINMNSFRLLDVDNRLSLLCNKMVRMMITSSDVIHSWTLPTSGVKVDAIPGRLNQTNMLITRPGVYYGQCSEICGAQHSFMPIVVEVGI